MDGQWWMDVQAACYPSFSCFVPSDFMANTIATNPGIKDVQRKPMCLCDSRHPHLPNHLFHLHPNP